MGLDSVELVMAIEERFAITVSDEEATSIRTVGEMEQLLMTKLEIADESSCLSQHAFHVLRRNVIACFGVNRRDFKLDSELDTFVPRRERRSEWVRFQKSVGAVQWPQLVRPREIVVLLSGMTLAIAALVWWYAAVGLKWGSVWAASLSFVSAVAIGWSLGLLTRPMRTTIPAGYRRVKEMAYFLVARNPELLGPRHPGWSPEEVWCSLRDVIIRQTALTEFDRNSRFVQDLHLD